MVAAGTVDQEARGEPSGGQGHAGVPDPGADSRSSSSICSRTGSRPSSDARRFATERVRSQDRQSSPMPPSGRHRSRAAPLAGLRRPSPVRGLRLAVPAVADRDRRAGRFPGPRGRRADAGQSRAGGAGHLSPDLRHLDRPVGDHRGGRRGLRRAAGMGDLGRTPGRPAAPARARRLGHARPVRRRHARLRLSRHLRLQRPDHAVPARPARRRHLRLGRLDLRAAGPRSGLHLLSDPARW